MHGVWEHLLEAPAQYAVNKEPLSGLTSNADDAVADTMPIPGLPTGAYGQFSNVTEYQGGDYGPYRTPYHRTNRFGF